MPRAAPNVRPEAVSDDDGFAAADARRSVASVRMLSLSDVAELLGISLSTLRRRVADGMLRVHRIGRARRVSEQDLRAFLAACRGEE